MKTQMNNLKKLALTACAILLIATGSYTQPGTGNQSNIELVSPVSLESLMSFTEESIRYMAPAVPESEAFSAEFERLDILAVATEASLKYEAPEVNDADVSAEMERLEWMAAATEASLKYEAPAVNDVTPEMERLEWLAAATEASLKYNAPEVNDGNVTGNATQNTTMFASTIK
jgi:hypothetical protein